MTANEHTSNLWRGRETLRESQRRVSGPVSHYTSSEVLFPAPLHPLGQLVLAMTILGIVCTADAQTHPNNGQPYVNCSAVTGCSTLPAAPSGLFLDASQFSGVDVNIFDAPASMGGPNNTLTDGIWMQGVENPVIGHLHCQGMSGYCEHYGISEPVVGGVFIAHDVLNVATGLIDLGPMIDNNQTLMTLASGVGPGAANGLLLDEKNGVSISTAAFPVIGEYLPGNLLAGGAGILGPTLYGHLNNGSTASPNYDSAGTCNFPLTGAATCSHMFSHTWNSAPVCTANAQTNIAPIKSTATTTSVVFSSTLAAGAAPGDTIGYHCEGNPN